MPPVAFVTGITGQDGQFVWDTSKPDGQPRRAISGDRARAMIGWVPKTPIDVGIETTSRWYQSRAQTAPR